MSNLKRFEMSVEVTAVDGSQVLACMAENETEAELMFKRGECEIIDQQIEVLGLEETPFEIEESEDISSRLGQDVIAIHQERIKELENALDEKSQELEHLSKVISEVHETFELVANDVSADPFERSRAKLILTKLNSENHQTVTEKLLGSYSIREPNENEVYFCKEGCGECSIVVVEEDNLRKTTKEGRLIERHYSKTDLSDCCHSMLGIWNKSTDQEMVAHYVFEPNEDK
ncbi:TPA: hypothetical protein P0E36_004899 [Vibrio harveyi]|nr:hypothetical protein [Vibrio harveyi]